MKKHPFLTSAAVCLAIGTLPTLVPADENHPMTSAARTVAYVHLYSDANGVSHFRDEKLACNPAPSPTATAGDQALATYEIAGAQGATVMSLKVGAKEDWHKAPRRMFLIVIQGVSEVTAGDGQVRQFSPGSVILMDDTTGKGHITRVPGTVDHVAIAVPAPAAK